MTGITKSRVTQVLGIAVGMTLLAEVIYFILWGLVLFPGGSVFNKVVWTFTCGIGMGAVIGALVLVFVEGTASGRPAIFKAALTMFGVGAYCTVLCSGIDASVNYFGGAENTALFVTGSIIPAALGGLFFGWVLYGIGQK